MIKILSYLVSYLVNKKGFYTIFVIVGEEMKKYLLLIEDEDLWKKFKECIDEDINTEIFELIKDKVKNRGERRK